MANLEIRNYAKSKSVKHWQIAEELGLTEFTFSRQLRHELSDTDKTRVKVIIDKLSGKTAEQA